MDLFDKAYEYTRADEVIAAGLYPYFRVNQAAVDTTVMMDGRKTVMVGSNNYLGLTSHPRVKTAAIAAVEKYGSGCTGSRFLNGTIDLHIELEERLAKFMQKEAALVFSTGFTTNQGVIATLVQKNDVVLCDRTNHASILDGCRLSYGKLIKFKHNDMEDLERLLIGLQDKKMGKLIVVDGVYSMEGDLADLKRIVPLAKKYGARLMVDEAHGLGVLGKRGRGTCEELGVLDQVDLVMGTFSKSLASLGGFVAGEKKVINYLKHHARSFIFQAAPPPSAVAAALEALKILEQEPERLQVLREHVAYMLKNIKAMGFRTWPTESAIIPIVVGDDLKTFVFAKRLAEEGVYVNPVVAPAVPSELSALRTSYIATHKREELDYVLEKLKKVGTELGLIGPNAPGSPVTIETIGSGTDKQLKKKQQEFLNLPKRIYEGNRNWVPPMITEVESIFRPKEISFSKHGEAQAFIAVRGSEVVGRIVAGMDHRANQGQKAKTGFFGFFEADQDYGVTRALLDAARQWLKEQGASSMQGPKTFSPLDGTGCLVAGQDSPPAIMMPYHPAYYGEYFEQYGLAKEQDSFAYHIDGKQAIPAKFEKMAEDIRRREGVSVRSLRRTRFQQEMKSIMHILNDMNKPALGYELFNQTDLRYFSRKLKTLIDADLVHFAETHRRPVGFSIVLPDHNEVLKRFNGKIRIADQLKYLYYSKKIKHVRFAMLGIKNEFNGRGLEALLYVEALRAAKSLGYTGVEISWVSEAQQHLMELIAAHGIAPVKTYRMYRMAI